jgi:hypothetical protein
MTGITPDLHSKILDPAASNVLTSEVILLTKDAPQLVIFGKYPSQLPNSPEC